MCNDIKLELIETIDACMAQQTQRRDIIGIFMRTMHENITNVMSYYWEKKCINLSPFDTLSLIDWVFNFIKELKMFGISDPFL